MFWLILQSILILPFCLIAEGKDQSYYIELATGIRSQHIEEMSKEGFIVTMTGGAFFDDVKEISLGFQLTAAPTLEQARCIYVKSVQKLLDRVNHHVAIQPYLHNRPFTINNLTYRITFTRAFSDVPKPELIAYVTVIKGTVYYNYYDPTSHRGTDYQTAHTEPFDDAVRIVAEREDSNRLPPDLCQSKHGWLTSLQSYFWPK